VLKLLHKCNYIQTYIIPLFVIEDDFVR